MPTLNLILADLSKTPNEKQALESVLKVMTWIKGPQSTEEEGASVEMSRQLSVRIKFLIQQLEKHPDWLLDLKKSVMLAVPSLCSSSSLALAGVSPQSSFIQDLVFRIQEKILPQAARAHNLESMIVEIFESEEDTLKIDQLGPSDLEELLDRLDLPDELCTELERRSCEGLKILSLLLAQEGLAIHHRVLGPDVELEKLPEYILVRDLNSIPGELAIQDIPRISRSVLAIEKHIESLIEQLPTRGVEIETVYLIHSQEQKLRRFKVLLSLLDPETRTGLSLRLFVSSLVSDVFEERSLRSFLKKNLSLIAQRIVQSNSHVGEHYVARDRRELSGMLLSAMGGGALTSVTVFLKQSVSAIGAVGFVKGFLDSLNYAGSFLAIQSLGFTLATKQPASTASYLTRVIGESARAGGEAVISTLRTQIVAIIGNLSTVFPICFLLSALSLYLGHPLFSATEVDMLFSTNDLLGPSALFATFTGVLLFTSSLIGGWFENFCHVTDLQNRVGENSRLKNWLGTSRALRLGAFINRNSQLLAGNISLGILLGLGPQLIKFFGIPMEVRHITLATGSFAASLPYKISENIPFPSLANAISGLLVIGIGNIAVSFALSLLLATAASQVSRHQTFKVIQISFAKLLRRPWLLIVSERQRSSNHQES